MTPGLLDICTSLIVLLLQGWHTLAATCSEQASHTYSYYWGYAYTYYYTKHIYCQYSCCGTYYHQMCCTSSSNTDSDSTSKGDVLGLSLGAFIGIAVGSVVGLLFFVLIVILCIKMAFVTPKRQIDPQGYQMNVLPARHEHALDYRTTGLQPGIHFQQRLAPPAYIPPHQNIPGTSTENKSAPPDDLAMI